MSESDLWRSVTSLPSLEPGEIQIWRVTLPSALEPDSIYRQYLSSEELDRAARLRAGRVRLQFLVTRTCLRILLGNILGLAPKDVLIALSTYGKPQTPLLHFNIAHSRETVLIALCRELPVGVDLEYLDRETEILDIARTSFTEPEYLEIEAADPAHRRPAFFNCWTRKEAVIKADGRGLSVPLNSFEVAVRFRAESTPVHLAGGATWFVSDLEVGPEAAGAIAFADPNFHRRTFLFPGTLVNLHPEA